MKGDWVTASQVITFVLVMARMSGVFIVAPLLSNRSVPARVKISLIIALSFLLMPLASKTNLVVTGNVQLAVYVIQEMTIGLIIGFVASLLFSTVQAGGEIFGMQVGYSIATILDPQSETNDGVLTTLYVVLGALFFLYLDGHHLIITALSKSFEILPLGHGFSMNIGYGLSAMAEKLLVMAIQIAAPVIVVVTVLNIIFGLISKISPQMNIYFNVGFIIGPLVGVGVLVLSMPLFKFLVFKMVGNLNGELLKVIHEMKGA